ncbi:PREDICTED: uncharacterized protein LOC107189912 [Dufourea novaeangliae]|uniref:uncharacterized protein LOC107189912 n=1 Tax=Dufourea novaeangliae TaxID=178035 RepID=UPI000767392B|nr:PREDICTED: uncharacterized protein LOC107189912 [Dufourea novaeangliae]
MISLHYCIWGLCESWEYCCGDNECCKESDLNSLLVTAIIFGALIFVALCCVCFYCGSRRNYAPFLKRYLRISYTLMSSQGGSKTINQDTTAKDCVVQVETTKVSL